MKVITLLNEKGGVGKTTLATHLAFGLAARGKRVMLIDTDPQGHATLQSGLKKAPLVYDLFVRNAEFKATAKGIPPERFGFVGEVLPTGKLWVVPSNVETRNIANSLEDVWQIWVKLQELQTMVDVVIFDTSPTPSLLHSSIYLASDALLIPTELTYRSFDGLLETMKRLRKSSEIRMKQGMKPLDIMGIIPMKFEGQTTEHTQNLQSLKNQFPDKIWQPVPKRILWQEAESEKLPVWSIDKNSKAALDAYRLIDQFSQSMSALTLESGA